MPDVLVRNLPDLVKRAVEERAKSAGRSLSEEIKHLIQLGIDEQGKLAATRRHDNPADAMRAAFADCLMTDEEHLDFERILAESRKGKPRHVDEFK